MMAFGILSRYLSRSFLKSFAVILACLFSIILLFDFAELQRRASSKDISLLLKVKMILLRAPHFLEHVLPFLIFTATLFIFWRLNRTNELLIFRSAGISLWRLVLSIFLTALAIGFIDLTIFNPLSSVLQTRYEKLEKRHLSKKKDNIKIESTGLWLSEKIGKNQAIYRSSKVNLKEMEFEDLNIIIVSPTNKFIKRLDAKKAQIRGDRLNLINGWETLKGESAAPFSVKSIETTLTSKTIEEMNVNKLTLSFWSLPPYIDLLEKSGLHSSKYKMIWQSMIASAFWGASMVILAAAFSCRPHRQGRTVLMILIGITLGFFLYFFKDVTFALGVSGVLPPFLAAWLPPLLTFLLGVTLVFYQEEG